MRAPRGRLLRAVAATLLAHLAAACALSHTVPDGAFADLSVDKALRLFDAENDVSAATDGCDQMRERLRSLTSDRRAADTEAHAAKATGDARLAAMWTRRSVYLDLARDYLAGRMQAQADVVLLARAKFELAKALLVKKNRLPGAESLDVKPFEAQSADVERRAQAALAAAARRRPAVERARGEWLKLRADVVAESLSSRYIPGEDEQPVYELW